MNLNPFALFAKKQALKQEADNDLPTDDVVWSEESVFWRGIKGTKYNPDALIGKKGFGIYRKMMLDEQVKAVVRFKRDAITSREYYFEVDKEALGEEEADRRVKICNATLEYMDGSFLDAINGMMSSMYQGFSVTEKTFKDITVGDLTYWGIKHLRLKPYDTFEFEVDDFGNILRLTQELNGQRTEVDLTKIIHHLNNPEYDEHYGQSELREAYRPWFHKDMAIRFWGMWLERHASGFKVATPKEGKTLTPGTREYTNLQNALSNTVNGASMIMSGNVDLEVHFPSNNVAFKEAVIEDNLAIAKALLVPNLMGITPSGQTGSFSQSDTQLEAFLWTLDADASRLEDTLNEQLFKELGTANFGDDNWPRFRFKPVSERKKMEIISVWKDLVTSGAVKTNDEDDAHIRKLIEFPTPADKKEGTTTVNQSHALNGAQVSALVDIIAKIGTGEITKKSAVSIIVNSFPIDLNQAEAMVADVEEGTKNVEPGGSDSTDADDDKDDAGAGGNGEAEDEDDRPDETVNGRVAQIAMSKAEKRVDFSVIERAALKLESEYSDQIANHLTSMVQQSIEKFKELDNPTEEIDAIRFTTRQKTKMGKLVDKALKEGWALGQKHSAIELDKAKGAAFSASHIDNQRIKFISEDYFKISSFKAAGKLTDDAQAKIERIILNGIKFDKTIPQIEEAIYTQFAQDGMITEEAAKQALGEAMMGLANPQARINTMLRTNLFEAINEARYSYFTDPVLDDFVQALEYSAVMDSRTSEICQHLDGHVHSSDSELWNKYRPPNHFNCRSILIPVTEIDEWKESKQPSVEPGKGFA